MGGRRPPGRGRMPAPRRSPVNPPKRNTGSGCSGSFSGSKQARYRLFGSYRSNFLRHYCETAERVRTKCRADCDVGRIATAGDQHPPDARDVVARIKGVPLATDIGFEPGCEIHRRIRDWYADIAQIARAVSRRDVHAATEGHGEGRIVPADAGAIAISFPRRPGGARVFVAEGNVLVNVIANGLDAGPAERRIAEPRPGDIGQPVGLAI